MAKKLMKAQNGKIVKSKTKAAEFSKDSANLDRDYKIFTNKKGTIVNYNKAEDNINNTMDKYGRKEVSKMGPVGKTIAKNKPDMFRKTGGITKNKTLYPAGAGLMKKGGAIKKYQPGGPTALKKAISDSTKADKDYSYAKQYPKDFSGSGSKAKYIEDLQTKMEAPGKIRKQIAKSKKK